MCSLALQSCTSAAGIAKQGSLHSHLAHSGSASESLCSQSIFYQTLSDYLVESLIFLMYQSGFRPQAKSCEENML